MGPSRSPEPFPHWKGLALLAGAMVGSLWGSPALSQSVGPTSTASSSAPSPPIVISAGGTYSGNWQSLDPKVAAVTVRTSDPVVIENCTIASASDGIQDWSWGNTKVTVRNCRGKALNPNVAGVPKGFFIVLRNFSSLVVEHNLIDGFDYAVNAHNYPAALGETTTGQTVSFRYNVVHDADGRFSDGHGGFQRGTPHEGTATWASALTAYFLRNANIEVAWNEIVNHPYISQPEDVISIPESRGLPGNPIHIHDNYIQGDNPADVTFPYFYGCGIQLGDSPSKTNVGYTSVHDNQVVNFYSCGISISSGHHHDVHHNRIVSARTLPDGTIFGTWRVALQIADNYWDTPAVADPWWHDDWMHDNAYSVVFGNGTASVNRFFDLGPTVGEYNNVDLLGHLATTADEQAEYVRWKQKLVDNGVTVGPLGMTIGDASVAEGDSGTAPMIFTINLPAPAADTASVDYVVVGGTATAGVDFIASQGTLRFPVGTTTRTISVPVIGDRMNEGNETLFVNLSNAVSATIVRPQGVGTILDDDPPGFAISDATVVEPASGTASARFTVTLSPAGSGTSTVGFATADGSASDPTDYAATAGTLTFLAGETSQAVSVPVNAHAVPDGVQTFFVDLLGSSGPAVTRARGMASIYDAGFYPVSPCRLLDTRVADQGPALSAGSTRTVVVGGKCGVPVRATAVSLDLTVVTPTAQGHLRLYPANAALPLVSAINYGAGQTRANNAIMALSREGMLSVLCGQSSGVVDLVLDVSGYFE